MILASIRALWSLGLAMAVVAACSTTPSPPIVVVPPCDAGTVALIPGEAEGAGGQVVFFFVAGTTGDRPCRLAPGTQASLSTPDGRLLARAASGDVLDGVPPPVVLLDPATGALRPDGGRRGQATISVFVGNTCEPGIFVVEVAIMQTGTTASGQMLGGGRCELPVKAPSLFVTPLEASG